MLVSTSHTNTSKKPPWDIIQKGIKMDKYMADIRLQAINGCMQIIKNRMEMNEGFKAASIPERDFEAYRRFRSQVDEDKEILKEIEEILQMNHEEKDLLITNPMAKWFYELGKADGIKEANSNIKNDIKYNKAWLNNLERARKAAKKKEQKNE